MYKYVLCELFISDKTHLNPPPNSEEETEEVAQMVLKHIHEGTAEILAFHIYQREIENLEYNKEHDNKPGTYFLISIEMLGVLWKTYKLRKKWKKHIPLLLELVRREITVQDLSCKLLSQNERESHIAIIKDYD